MQHTPANQWVFTPVHARRRERAEFDYETRSAAQIKNGAWLYSKHPSTRILCISFALPGQVEPSLYAPPMGGQPAVEEWGRDEDGRLVTLDRFFDYIREGGLVEAHNVNFEACITLNLASKPFGFDENGLTGLGMPVPKDSQYRCSAAKAAALALPRKLEQLGPALGLAPELQKDDAGGRVMLKLTKPRKAKRGEPKVDDDGEPIIYYPPYKADEFRRLYDYNKQDIVAERAASELVPDLSESEYQVWLADFRANMRGVLVDLELCRMAIKLDAELKAQMNATLYALTGIHKGTERAKILAWLEDRGVSLPDSTAATLDHLMGLDSFQGLGDDVQTVVQIARNINRTSITKFKRIVACADPDDHRVRELVLYHGAATGRWSGKGIQVQNFPKGDLDVLVGCEPGTVKLAQAIADIMTGNLAWLQCLYGDVLSLLSSVLRGALIPTPGKVFYVADYSAIEARVVLWLAGAVKALEVFTSGGDIYMDMATGIYGYPVTDKKKQKAERAFGKVAVLGLGYGMGYLTFLLTLRSYNIKFKPADAIKIMGDKADKYMEWVTAQLWPKLKPDADAEERRLFKGRKRKAQSDLRRLRDEREIPEEIIAELALCKFTVDAYRKRYPEVPKLWKAQESAACQAVIAWKKAKREAAEEWETVWGYQPKHEHEYALEPIPVTAGYITWVVQYLDAHHPVLFAYLPSGRRLAYNNPDVALTKTPWGEGRPSLRFMGVHKKSKKWARMASYGGSIVENVDQATARDMMAEAMIRIDETSRTKNYAFDFLASIHDEALTEAPDDGEDHSEELEDLMADISECYAGCPVEAEGARLMRYQK